MCITVIRIPWAHMFKMLEIGFVYSWKFNPVQGPHNIALIRLCYPECVLEHQFNNYGSLRYLCFSYEFSLLSSVGSN